MRRPRREGDNHGERRPRHEGGFRDHHERRNFGEEQQKPEGSSFDF